MSITVVALLLSQAKRAKSEAFSLNAFHKLAALFKTKNTNRCLMPVHLMYFEVVVQTIILLL